MPKYRNNVRIAMVACLLLIFTTGCNLLPYTPDKTTGKIPAEGPLFHEKYVIGPGDVIRITDWENPKLADTVTVYPDGRISFPLLEDDIMAEGKTPRELAKELDRLLGNIEFGASVTVVVDTINSLEYSVLGEGVSQGVYPLTRRTSILEAIARAGGLGQFTERNNIILLRQIDGKERRYRFDFDDFVENPNSEYLNSEMLPGDVLLFP